MALLQAPVCRNYSRNKTLAHCGAVSADLSLPHASLCMVVRICKHLSSDSITVISIYVCWDVCINIANTKGKCECAQNFY